MNKMIILGLAATFGTANVLMRTMLANPSVELQPVSPGVSQTGHLNVSGTATAGIVRAGTMFGNSTVAAGVASGGDFRSASTSGRALYGLASATSGLTYGGFFQNSSSTGRAVFGLATATSGSNYGGYFQAAGNSGRGVVGSVTAASGDAVGGYFTSASSNGRGVVGVSTGVAGGIGVYGSASANGYAGYFAGQVQMDTLRTGAAATGSLQTFGAVDAITVGYGAGTSATMGLDSFFGWLVTTQGGIMGVTQQGSLHMGVGSNSAMANFGKAVFFQDTSSNMASVYARNGEAPAGLSPGRRGLYAESGGADGSYGATLVAKSTGGSSYGLESYAIGAQATNFAVYGYASGGATNYAGFFSGLLFANSATSSVKSFLIDHPQDPENKFLEHSSIESDQRMDVYRGVVTTDPQGYADIAMPGWFSSLNEDIQYQLTIVDTKDSSDFVLAKVVKKYDGRTFRIRTSAPKIEVNWLVSGVRHDQTSQYLPLVVERDKKPHERGRYLLPEAFGKDRSYAMEARPKETPNKAPLKQD